jgi:phage shock protein PspC (stress-responsive transcriptional regulator)
LLVAGEDESMTQDDWLHNFSKSETDRWIGGVRGGLGEHTPIPSWIWRLLFTLLVLCFGTGFLVYILLWIFVPRKAKT